MVSTPALQCGGYAIAADGVRRHFFPDAVRFLDDGLGFFVGEIDVAVQHAIRSVKVAVVGVILDPVRAEHDLFANRFARFFRAVDVLHALRKRRFPRSSRAAAIHSSGRHGPRGHLHARAGHFAIGDGLLDVDIGIHRSFGLQVAHRGEAVRERDLCIACREDRAVREWTASAVARRIPRR